MPDPIKPAAKMNADTFAMLRRRYRTQKSLRSNLDGLLDEIDYYTGPVKEAGASAYNPQGGTGANLEQRKDLWDFTAIEGREKLSASIFGSAMGSSYRWFFFNARDPELQKDQEVASWMSDESEACWNDIQDSDFGTEMPSVIHEMCGNGNGFIAQEPLVGDIIAEDYGKNKDGSTKTRLKEAYGGQDFTAIPVRECFFEPDRKGGVKTFWRRCDWTPSQVVDFCEDKEIPVPEDIMDKLKKGTDERMEIVFCVFQRPEIIKKKKVTYPAAADKRPYGYVWWREQNAEQLGEEGGYYEQPIKKGVWSKTAGSKWGHGPGNVALPTVKYVNAWKERLRTAGEKVLDPALMAEERNILSDVDLKAGGVTLVRKMDGLKPLESGSKFDVGEKMLAEDQKQIRDIFHVDELQLKDSPQMTATEAQIRYEWMMRLLGKTLGFIQAFLLGPIAMDTLAMRIRTGAAKPMPAKLKKAGGLMNIEYQGPLARSQRTDEVAAIERLASFIAGLAQFYPEIRAALDPLVAVKLVAQRLGVPANIMPPDVILRQKMKEIVDSMQQAQQADTEQKSADAQDKRASAASKKPDRNNAPLGGSLAKTPLQYPGLPPKPGLNLSGRQPGGPLA